MAKRPPKRELTRVEWQAFATGLYDFLLTTATVQEAEIMRRSIHRVQTPGYDFAGKLFHGEGWVYLA